MARGYSWFPLASNLEVKARDTDPVATIEACRRLGAEDRGELWQRDTYFPVPRGRFKLREHLHEQTAELIYYERPDSTHVRESRYTRVPVEAGLRTLLADALGTVGVVEKRRRLFLHRHVRIHVDEVVGAGSFVELEAVMPEATEEALAEVMAALGFDERELVAGSYSDVVSAPYVAEIR